MSLDKETSGGAISWLAYFPIWTVILIVASLVIIWALTRGRDIAEA